MNVHELRNELRIRSRGYFEIVIDGKPPISATLRDISPSGLCLETKEPLDTGTMVRLENVAVAAEAVVRYCRQEGSIWRIGVALLPPAAA